MVKIDNINQVSAHFEDVVKDSINQTYADWNKNHYSKLWHLQAILDELKVYLPTNGDGHNLPEELWQEFRKKIEKIISWTESIKYTSDGLSLKSLSYTWQKGFNDIQFNLPEIIKLEIRPELFIIQAQDKNSFRIRKRIYGFLKNVPLNIHGSKSNIRVIDLHNFLTNYLEVPVTKSILKLWQEHLNEITKQYEKLFEKISELKENILFLDELTKLQDPFEKIEYFEKIYTIAEILNQTDIVLQSMREKNGKLNDFIEEEWQHISEVVDFCWQYAGTYILPNRKYRPEVLSYNKKTSEKNFKKIKKYWCEHFEALKTSWLKNLELYILQIKTIEELRLHSKELVEKNVVLLNPAFENALTVIQNEEGKYLSKHKDNGFSSKLKTTESEFIKNLNNIIIPRLNESLYQSRISESLEDYLQNIESYFTNTPESFILSRFHANGTLYPKSKKVKIDFRKLLFNDFVQSNNGQYIQQVEETKNRLQSISRSLAEIRTLFELNIRSAKNVLNNRQGSTTLTEAVSILQTSFRRSKKIIENSWENSKESIEYAKEILLQNSLQLYKNLESLVNNEHLIENQLKLKRDKNQIYLNDLARKFFHKFYNSFKKLYKYIHKNFKLLIGESPDQKPSTFEEFCLNRNKVIEYNLSQIPLMYQKLFTDEHEPESGFYLKREMVEVAFRNCFQKWKEGENPICVLLGETGAGKSSTLNFIEKQFSADHNVYRVNVLSRFSTENEMFSIFQNSLNIKKINSFETLQDSIITHNNSAIIMVDNLHNLVLNTPANLELLENFLLLIQNTRKYVFWIFTCSIYSWLIYDSIMNISEVINYPIQISNFTKDEIKQIILDRHKISGHLISFEASEIDQQSRKYRKLKAENHHNEYLEERFFDQLYHQSGGNISVAFKYWLASIVNFSEEKIVLKSLPPISEQVFGQLKKEDQFTLISFIKNPSMTSKECSQINNILAHQNKLMLNRLVNLGLLEKTQNQYHINPVYFTAIHEFAESQNLLFETNGKNAHVVTIKLYFPVHSNTLQIKRIVKRVVALSKFVDLSKEVSINFVNQIFDGISMYQVEFTAAITHPKYEQSFKSEVTEAIFGAMANQGHISEKDFSIQ